MFSFQNKAKHASQLSKGFDKITSTVDKISQYRKTRSFTLYQKLSMKIISYLDNHRCTISDNTY